MQAFHQILESQSATLKKKNDLDTGSQELCRIWPFSTLTMASGHALGYIHQSQLGISFHTNELSFWTICVNKLAVAQLV